MPTRGFSLRFAKAAGIFLFGVALTSCRHSPPEPVTINYTYSFNEDRPQVRARLQRFTQDTGIRVKGLPIPEYSRNYLDLARKLLKDGATNDVLNIDVIWSPILEPDLIDLRPYLQSEIPLLEPQLLAGYTVNDKLVAVPFNVPLGGIEYRADLLKEYGYDHPPETWDELESMAARIQAGERAKGIKDFWGYVWQGGAGEALTCNALEWQAAAGGGRIIESDRTISVNNPAAIRSWQRARHWIGWISPPGVVAYRELDSMLVFDSGRAAFDRVWVLTPMTKNGHARQIAWRSRPLVVKTEFSRMPGGVGGRVSTLGGTGTAISLRSAHRPEAVAFLRFQLRELMETGERSGAATSRIQADFSGVPSLPGSHLPPSPTNRREIIITRPYVASGSGYKQVTKAYFDAVHSVLTGERSASAAASDLEKQLVEITGFRIHAPKAAENVVN